MPLALTPAAAAQAPAPAPTPSCQPFTTAGAIHRPHTIPFTATGAVHSAHAVPFVGTGAIQCTHAMPLALSTLPVELSDPIEIEPIDLVEQVGSGLGRDETATAVSGSGGAAKPKAGRMQPCKACASCLRADCGTCKNCVDKPKFGGLGMRKQLCVLRKCENPNAQVEIEPPAPIETAEAAMVVPSPAAAATAAATVVEQAAAAAMEGLPPPLVVEPAPPLPPLLPLSPVPPPPPPPPPPLLPEPQSPLAPPRDPQSLPNDQQLLPNDQQSPPRDSQSPRPPIIPPPPPMSEKSTFPDDEMEVDAEALSTDSDETNLPSTSSVVDGMGPPDDGADGNGLCTEQGGEGDDDCADAFDLGASIFSIIFPEQPGRTDEPCTTQPTREQRSQPSSQPSSSSPPPAVISQPSQEKAEAAHAHKHTHRPEDTPPKARAADFELISEGRVRRCLRCGKNFAVRDTASFTQHKCDNRRRQQRSRKSHGEAIQQDMLPTEPGHAPSTPNRSNSSALAAAAESLVSSYLLQMGEQQQPNLRRSTNPLPLLPCCPSLSTPLSPFAALPSPEP